MPQRTILVTDYNPQWAEDYKTLSNRIIQALGNICIRVEHVGSTSVIGLAAKPIIDMDIVILSSELLPQVISKLASIGYAYEGNLGVEDRDAFCYTGNQPLPVHNLYVCPEYSKELHRHITFRDYLRSHADAVLQYGTIKKEAAKLYPHDIDGYIMHKMSVVAQLYQKCGL